ncbi:MAG: SPOR domain-containing protein [Flavobacteriales bacterium]
MNAQKIIVISLLALFISEQSYAQDDRNFWQRLFGKKSEQIDVEEPKNSQDSLATLINKHLDAPDVPTEPETDPTDVLEEDTTVKENSQTAGAGSLSVVMDDKIKTWLDTVASSEPRGFRIQVFMGDLTEARGIRSRLLGEGERATIKYNVADYYVRIGDFRSYMEAEKKLAAIRSTYPSAYVVKDKIKLK